MKRICLLALAGGVAVVRMVAVCARDAATIARGHARAAAQMSQQTLPAASGAPSATRPAGTIQGVIKSGQTPLPGVSVTAKNTLTGKQYVTATDSRGAFTLHIDEDGRYVVRADFAGFASTTKEVLLHGGAAPPQTEFSLLLASRQQQMEQAEARRGAGQGAGQGAAAVYGRAGRAESGAAGGGAGGDCGGRRGGRSGAALRRGKQ